MRSIFIAIGLFGLFSQSQATDLHGRVIDRGTLRADGYAKGISGVKVSIFDGKRLIASATTNSKGHYRIRKIPVSRFRAIYKVRNYHPNQVSRAFALAASDTASRDVYLDAAPLEKGEAGKKGKGKDKATAKKPGREGYYPGLARGFVALTRQESFFREDLEDKVSDLSGFFDGRDETEDYVGVMCELLWAEFLSQERPLETRYYLAAALRPLLDSLGWGSLRGMDPYLEVSPEAVREVASGMREAIRTPAKLPSPKDVRSARVPLELASRIASEYLAAPGLSEKAKDRFLARWKKTWGKDAPSFQEDSETGFDADALLAGLADAKPQSPTVLYLRGRGLYAAGEFTRATEILGAANRLKGNYPSAKHLEAMAYLRLGRDQDAFGRFQALREAQDPFWKAKAFQGLGRLALKDKRHSEAASNLSKAARLVPDPETIDMLAEASLKLTDRTEVDKLLRQRTARGDHRAEYWLGRFAEIDNQTGIAEDHYRKAWSGAPAAEYAEALARLYISREEYGPALALLEPLRARLTSDGRRELAECLLQAGRSLEASREFQAAHAADPSPELLARYVESLVRANRTTEALGAAASFSDASHPLARFAMAKAQLANNEPDKARPILEELVKLEENNAEYHYLLGVCYFEDRNYSKAKREFDEALRFRQDYQEAIYYTGLCGIKLGRPEAARNYFNELTQRTSSDWKAKGFLGLGLSFAAMQKPEAAENFYQRSLDVVETAEAQALLALSRRRLGAPEQWVPQAKKAYELDLRHPKAVLAMGEAMIAQGKKAQAVKHFREALVNNPNSCDLLAGLAKSQFLTGAYEAGKVAGSKAIAICPQEPEPYYYAAVSSDKLRKRKEAEGYFKAYRKAGGDVAMLPEDYR